MEVNITTFYNPHLFWIFELKNTTKRELLENEFQKYKFEPVASPVLGQIVMVCDSKWKRAIIKSVRYPYRCWLLDYGVPHETKQAFKIPTEFQCKSPLAKQASLIDVVCLIQVHLPTGVESFNEDDFTYGSIKRTQEYLNEASKICFTCLDEINNVHLGNLEVVSSQGTQDLSTILIKEKVLVVDKDLFKSAFQKNCKTDDCVVLQTSSCGPHLLCSKLAHLDDITTTQGCGRGSSRSTSKKERLKSKKEALAEWVTQSKLVVERENLDYASDEEEEAKDVSSSISQTSSHSKRLPLQHLREAYKHMNAQKVVGENSPTNVLDVFENNKPILSSASANKIKWSDFENDTQSTMKHLNIPPSGMLQSTVSNKGSRKKHRTPEKSQRKTESYVSSISESSSVKNLSETHSQLQKPCVIGCKCEQCFGWSGGDLYFNEKKRDCEDMERKKLREYATPSLLLKAATEPSDNQGIRSCVVVSDTNIKRSTAPTLLVHGSTFLSPVTAVTAAPFHEDIHKALRTYEQVYNVQSYVWPALMRHMNVCVIANRNSGKTMAYLPGICSFELERNERYPDLPANTISPLTIIVCPGVVVAEKVFNMILTLLENASVKSYIAMAVQPIDKKCLNQFQKQVDILVATPSTLISLLTARIISMKRLCHFIIEKADIVLEKFTKEVDSVLHLIQSMLSHRTCNYTVQMVITSEQWTLPIEALLKSLNMVPVVCIGSYLEAAMYGRVDLKLHFLESQLKMSTLANFLKGKAEICRTVVICNTNDEIEEAKEFFVIAGVSCLFITDDMSTSDILEVETRWLHSVGGKHFALICTEQVFNHSINITNAVLLVNYSLPSTWTQFVTRFRCLLDNYISPLTTTAPDEWTRCTVQIFVDESCSKQFSKVVKLMERLGVKLTSNFQNFHKNTLEENEKAKIISKIRLCNELRLFGKCSSIQCRKRHILSNELDYVGALPKNGIIKFKIVHLQDVTCFSIKLLEHTDADGKTHKWELYDNIEKDLNEIMTTLKSCVYDVKPGMWYVYHSLEEQHYHRCAVRRIVSSEKITKRATVVSIRCLDTGVEMNVSCSFLYKLPKQFCNVPPQVIDVYLANMVPPDADDAWSFYSRSKVRKILDDAGYNKNNTYEVGQILFQLGNMLWLKNIMMYEDLETTNLKVNKLNLRKMLLQQNIVNACDKQLVCLYKLCESAQIELPNYNVNKGSDVTHLEKQVKPQWAHFEESDCTEIYISYVDTPSLFYVRIKNFDNLFVNLQKEIQKTIAKPFYPAVSDVTMDKCYLAKDPSGDDFARVVITEIIDDIVKVFFVDFGDYTTINKSELKYLPDELITKLPFQAIECRLYGVDPAWDEWEITAIHKLFNFVFEPNTDFYRSLYTTSCKEEVATVTGGLKYAVLLVDNFDGNMVIINKLFIDCGEAVPLKHESINTEFTLPELQVEEDEDDISDIDMEMTIDEIRKYQEKYSVKTDEVPLPEISEESIWEIQVNDTESFIKQLFLSNDAKSTPNLKNTQRELPPLTALPPTNYSTPNVRWYQTDTHIKINIMLSVSECDIQVIRGKMLIFGTVYNNNQYKLNLNLFDNVEKLFQYTLSGPHIQITLKKKVATEWPRLILSSHKVRYIRYDATQCKYEEEKERRFLDLDLDDDDDDDKSEQDDRMAVDLGSDENYSESDFESDLDN